MTIEPSELTKMKWTNVGEGTYQSGPWTIERHDGYPHPGTSWVIYQNGTFVARLRTFTDAKNAVSRS